MQTDIRAAYPRMNVNLGKLRHNIRNVVSDCNAQGIEVCGVVKGFNGLERAVEEFVDGGCMEIGTSRVFNIRELRESGMDARFLLLRIPMMSELEDVVEYVDTSLQSDLDTLRELDRVARRMGRTHSVILMADLGDLREGFWDREEMVQCGYIVETELKNLTLRGVGTNLGCYGSIKPTVDKMEDLIEIAEMIEDRIGRKLETISGGATSSYPLVLDGTMPERINHLRIGEGIMCAYDLPELWGLEMDNLYKDVFTLEAQVIEVRRKPTHPVGEIIIDCFGRKPEYVDRGIRKRALIAAGKLDYALDDKIFPEYEGMEIIGSSSDHLIVDIEDCEKELKTGDIVRFNLSYPSVMYLTNDVYVSIGYI